MPLCGERPSLSDLLWFRWGHWLYLTMSSRQSVKYLGEWILPPVLWGPRWAPLLPLSALSLSLLAHRFLLAGASHSPSIVLRDGHYGVWAHSVTGATGVTSRAGERVSPAWYKWLPPCWLPSPSCVRGSSRTAPRTQPELLLSITFAVQPVSAWTSWVALWEDMGRSQLLQLWLDYLRAQDCTPAWPYSWFTALWFIPQGGKTLQHINQGFFFFSLSSFFFLRDWLIILSNVNRNIILQHEWTLWLIMWLQAFYLCKTLGHFCRNAQNTFQSIK